MSVTTQAELTGTTCTAARQHLGKHRLAGLVSVRHEGRRRIYAARDTHVRTLIREALYHADHVTQNFSDHPSPIRQEHSWPRRRLRRGRPV